MSLSESQQSSPRLLSVDSKSSEGDVSGENSDAESEQSEEEEEGQVKLGEKKLKSQKNSSTD